MEDENLRALVNDLAYYLRKKEVCGPGVTPYLDRMIEMLEDAILIRRTTVFPKK